MDKKRKTKFNTYENGLSGLTWFADGANWRKMNQSVELGKYEVRVIPSLKPQIEEENRVYVLSLTFERSEVAAPYFQHHTCKIPKAEIRSGIWNGMNMKYEQVYKKNGKESA